MFSFRITFVLLTNETKTTMRTMEYIEVISETSGRNGKLKFGFEDLSVYYTPHIKNGDFMELTRFLHINEEMQEKLSLNIEQYLDQ